MRLRAKQNEAVLFEFLAGILKSADTLNDVIVNAGASGRAGTGGGGGRDRHPHHHHHHYAPTAVLGGGGASASAATASYRSAGGKRTAGGPTAFGT